MVISSTICENFMFVRLSYAILLRFENCQFQYSFFPLNSFFNQCIIEDKAKYFLSKKIEFEALCHAN